MMLLREITAGLVLWGFSLAVLSSCRLNLGAVRNTSTTILRAPTNQKAGSRFGVIPERILWRPATGKQITVKRMVVDRVVAGKMVESQILMDGLSMMRQLGAIPG